MAETPPIRGPAASQARTRGATCRVLTLPPMSMRSAITAVINANTRASAGPDSPVANRAPSSAPSAMTGPRRSTAFQSTVPRRAWDQALAAEVNNIDPSAVATAIGTARSIPAPCAISRAVIAGTITRPPPMPNRPARMPATAPIAISAIYSTTPGPFKANLFGRVLLFLSLSLAALASSASWSQASDANSEQRAAFMQAWKQAGQGNDDALRQAIEQIPDYVLTP